MLAARGQQFLPQSWTFFYIDGGRLSKVFIGHHSTVRLNVLPLYCPHTLRLDWARHGRGRMTVQQRGVEVPGSLFATSDLHSSHSENRRIIDEMRPESSDDWLIAAGDVDDTFSKIEKALSLFRRRYAKVIWTPGNHELWTLREDPVQRRGAARYQALVQMCRHNDILTPEDEFAI